MAKTPTPKTPATSATAAAPVVKTKKVRRAVPNANIYITASYNNTLMTATDQEGKALAWSSAGTCGFKGSRKSTPYAATVTGEKLIEKLQSYGVQKVKVFVNGVGTGREQSVRGLQAAGLELEAIFDVTAIPHNGCRARKSRRI
ncbi:MAG: 30S ribosomal protein S11 [Candidatus Peregrinibacteria bacterium]